MFTQLNYSFFSIMKTILKQLLPPIIYTGLLRSSLRKYGWFGNYKSWDEALSQATGYDSDLILNKVLQATLKVKNGEAAYEQDSVIFDKIIYDWPVLSALLWVAGQNSGELSVLDFGGSLGRSYFQNRKFLKDLKKVRWGVVEQKNFIETGKKYLQDDQLRFYFDIPSCLNEINPQVVLLSSVLPYIEKPYDLLQQLGESKIQHVIIDRLPFISGEEDRITIQNVSPHIYRASYPAWFFSETKFLQFINERFDVVEEYDCNLHLNIRSEVKGLILRLKA